MTMTTKIWLVILVVGFTVINLLILTGLWGVIGDNIQVAIDDPTIAANGTYGTEFALYRNAVMALPFWLYLICPIVSIIEVVIILKAKEIGEGIRGAVNEFRNG